MKSTVIIAALLFGATAMADTYKVDPNASKVEWKAGKKVGSFHNGDVKVKNGTIETDAKGLVKNASVVVDMKSIANEDLKGSPDYQKKLVGHLSSDDFFKVEKHPESTFVLKSLTPKAAKGEYVAKGDLTMIGKTEAVEFPVTITQVDKTTLAGKGTVKIERLKWGLQYGSGSIFKSLTADKIINDSFDLTLDLIAKK